MENDPSTLASFLELDRTFVPEWGIALCGFIDGSGEARFETTIYGTERIMSLIGALEILKQDLVMMCLDDGIEFELDDEDDDEED